MLLDEVQVLLKAGHGGAGRVSFNPGRRSGPNGGNGGRGGDIYITVTTDLWALNQFSKEKIKEAQNGEMGGVYQQAGKDGVDLEIKLPIGTEIEDLETGEKFEFNDLDKKILICEGGLGGRGNYEFRSSKNTTPMYAQKGLPGQMRNLKVELKFLADFGLIGIPNAGKSSLLNELTSANVKTADYPFTTLEPNLGVFGPSAGHSTLRDEPSGSDSKSSGQGHKIIADIPGLIEGASEGKGLGIKFLKHIEKVGLLLHCIAADSEDVLKDYKTVTGELQSYNPEILNKKEIILLTKSDLVDKKDLDKKIKTLKKLKKEVLPISIHDFDSLENLKQILNQV